MNSIDNKTQSAVRKEEVAPPRPLFYREPVVDYSDSVSNIKKKLKISKRRKSRRYKEIF
jgi:hypothetical protein